MRDLVREAVERWRAETRDSAFCVLLRTQARERLSTVREDAVEEGGVGVFASNAFRFSERFRTYVGVRYDRYHFDVDSLSLPENSGSAEDPNTSLKASLVYRPVDPLELYASYGQGFHSNDARGTTIVTGPVSGDPADPVDPLVDSEGAEFGARVFLSDRLQATAALWTLELDSELLFVGDAGNTEASRPSRRDGFEAGLYDFGEGLFSGEIEASYTDSQLEGDDPAGDDIPGSIPLVISGGVTAQRDGYSATVRVRYFAPYPLIEDDSVESDGSTLVNLRLAKSFGRFGLKLEVLNALDSDDHDIDYFYASRLPGEPDGGVEDDHFNVFPSRSVRLSARATF